MHALLAPLAARFDEKIMIPTAADKALLGENAEGFTLNRRCVRARAIVPWMAD